MKRRIAFISDHASPLATPGGVDSGAQNVYVAELAKQLSLLGYEIDIFTRKDNADKAEVSNWQPGIRIIYIKAGPETYVKKERLLYYIPDFVENILAFIRRGQETYDLIHAHFFTSGWVAAELKKILGIPYVLTFHDLGIVSQMRRKGIDPEPEERIVIESILAKDADHIIAGSEQDKEDLLTHYEGIENRITIVPYGFDPGEFYPMDKMEARQVLQLGIHEKIILQLGRIEPGQGVDNVIRALAGIRKNVKNVRLVIVGGEGNMPEVMQTPELKRLQEIAIHNGVLDNILFTGKKSRDLLRYYYAAADVFVTTPWYQSFSITPLESMACGTPVIGTNTGGIRHCVIDKDTGFLVPPGNPAALAEKTVKLLGSEKQQFVMRRNALLRMHRFFTWEKIARTIHGVYTDTLHTPVMPVVAAWQSVKSLVASGQQMPQA